MNKKLVSERNPQGVEYPEAVTADGSLVSAIDLEKGSEGWDEMKFYFPGCESSFAIGQATWVTEMSQTATYTTMPN